MYYGWLLLVSLSVIGCTESMSSDPITSANGLTFISSRMPDNEDEAKKDNPATISDYDFLECEADKLMQSLPDFQTSMSMEKEAKRAQK